MLALWTWLVNSRVGQIIAAAGTILIALLLARRSGRKDAERQQQVENLKEYRDVRDRADEAARDADDDTRPVDDRLREHNAFRD